MTKRAPAPGLDDHRMEVAAALLSAEKALLPFEHTPFAVEGVTVNLTQIQVVAAAGALRMIRDALRSSPYTRPSLTRAP